MSEVSVRRRAREGTFLPKLFFEMLFGFLRTGTVTPGEGLFLTPFPGLYRTVKRCRHQKQRPRAVGCVVLFHCCSVPGLCDIMRENGVIWKIKTMWDGGGGDPSMVVFGIEK